MRYFSVFLASVAIDETSSNFEAIHGQQSPRRGRASADGVCRSASRARGQKRPRVSQKSPTPSKAGFKRSQIIRRNGDRCIQKNTRSGDDLSKNTRCWSRDGLTRLHRYHDKALQGLTFFRYELTGCGPVATTAVDFSEFH